MKELWKPTTTHNGRQARAWLLRTIREFFYQRQVLEVDTPILSHGTVTDVHLAAFSCRFDHSVTGAPQTLYLQTSPEYAMKRLLCAQSGPIYQIIKAFRHEGAGRWHNPEFTMLEWYRPGFDHHQLMDEMDALLQETLKTSSAQRFTYQEVFVQYLNLDPLIATDAQVARCVAEQGIDMVGELPDRDSQLQLLFSIAIEPNIGQQNPCFVYSFPASQAALARLNSQDPRVADRFEVYFKGAELANGFYELAEPGEQRQRFMQDNALRAQHGLPQLPLDEHFLAALESGLPECSGVALGIDRLLMLMLDAQHIEEVINFPVHRA
ncbi:elongation factor P--(R)-beta-lysine ligase [Alteromonas aestuariivivens]|uniref:Elongation factor P--(R)-beta-lysine ligase n=1 Tax=Alteromonas aestuariivivens TaxID=1938339 RepID=A0A3D8MBV1_9ALTE|nr:elongation factor P--(R)-beta-lysine ligase [Alteromonas aestuariivivens]RDV28008.1 elongation factor P--(R)-beta-lysine ligase [Alteromonas aestuariivivens]